MQPNVRVSSPSEAAKTVLAMISRSVHHGGINQRTITDRGHLAYARASDQARPELDRWPSNINGPHLPYYYELADGVWKHGAGNCDAQGMIAALLIAAHGVFPVEFMSVTIENNGSASGHAFAVVGRPRNPMDLQQPQKWGRAWICDPWQGFAYPAQEVRRKMWCGAMAPGGSLAYGRGNQASFCTDGRALDEFEVQARFEGASDIPPRVLKLWRSRVG